MRALIAAFCLMLSVQGGWATEPVFPPASRIGLVPPEDMVLSRRFSGFENPEKAAAISLVEMPAEAYGQVASGLTEEALKRQGMNVTSREDIKLGDKAGVLVAGTMTAPVTGRKWLLAVKDETITALLIAQVQGLDGGYTQEQMRQALTSVALRGAVSLEEQISALPFRITDQAGFRPIRTLSGNSVVLTDGAQDVIKAMEQPVVILAASLMAPPPPGAQREQFARTALNSNQILRNIRIERSESFRLKGQDWHEIVARATDAESGQDVVVLQSIRFELDRYVRMVGLTRADQRDRNLTRFRTIIDSLETRP